jgi:(p)ppGpp synthase/HD superfamily hydrolase
MLQVAINFAKEKHKFQLDKADEPYINHLMWVMDDMDSNVEKIVAILHDIVEDTDVEFEDLIKLGFSDEIVEAIKAITKAKGQDYDEYLEQVKKNDIARKVKLSDLYHNMDLRRLKEITELDLKRKEKYEKAFECLIKK